MHSLGWPGPVSAIQFAGDKAVQDVGQNSERTKAPANAQRHYTWLWREDRSSWQKFLINLLYGRRPKREWERWPNLNKLKTSGSLTSGHGHAGSAECIMHNDKLVWSCLITGFIYLIRWKILILYFLMCDIMLFVICIIIDAILSAKKHWRSISLQNHTRGGLLCLSHTFIIMIMISNSSNQAYVAPA